MGDDDTSTAYAAELRGIEMALNSTLNSAEQWAKQAKKGLVIFTDSQAALKALRQLRMPSGQVYLEGCLDLIRRHAANSIRTELRRIPALQGVAGNELVDRHAKEAALEQQGPGKLDNQYICVTATAKRRIRREAKAEWEIS